MYKLCGGVILRILNIFAVSAICLILCSCSVKPDFQSEADSSVSSLTEYSRPNESIQPVFPDSTDPDGYVPLNFTNQIGIWYPYMDYAEYMQGKSEDEFRSYVNDMFTKAKQQSVNTVYVHMRPCGDAYYDSKIFPRGAYLDGGYDPLQIMIQQAHELGLSIHAWINPLRLQTEEQMKSLPDDFIVKQWVQSNDATFVNIVNGRYYLNPAYEEVIDLICRSVEEIIQNYDVDGIHIDDYFYPTTSPDFDQKAFEASGHSDLSQWRLENCSHMISSIYESVKRSDSKVLFGISPQGNINANYSSQYADVRLWTSSDGYCDYIVPQIYFGFKNETCPFAETLAQWEQLVTNDHVSLIIGLAPYKQGTEDKWAGTAGELEWTQDPDIIKKQIELTEKSSADGYALYY